ncbi:MULTISPECIES: MFS transporter [Pseudomonas]|uniref:MFS transporter n=1 Tax=Pseudomonas auratipiscis TaxID=3115853 RepID=A0AB35WVI5_9PSED|nr:MULTISPECIES: MFS transporter [unclassified Pseudomonas]MEE1867933.1 MFS transporter [Pseudomonas sp. 120P]MEE1959483.1 MFS transporter [Pseudomonas sp. 119P]
MSTSATTNTSSTAHSWLAVIAVGFATFSVVTTEMLPVGLLTTIAASLDTSTGTAGLMISLPALLAALFAPVVIIAAGGIERRTILCALLGLLMLANIASALAPDIVWMLAARIVVGLCMGGIWAIAGGLAPRLVRRDAIGLATSIIFGGVAAASVLGVPLGALIGDFAGWRWAFGAMAALNAVVLVLHLAFIPALTVERSASVRLFLQQFGNRRLQYGLGLTLMLVAGHFATFTYVRPLLMSVSGFEAQWIGALLFGYGIAGIAGNFLAGIIAARRTAQTLMAIALGLLLTPALFLSIGGSHLGGGLVLLAWGLAYGGVSVSLMTWIMKAAPRGLEIATALYVSVFNIAIAAGSWTGGQIVDSLGLRENLYLLGGSATIALLLALAMSMSKAPQEIADSH